MEKFYGYVGIFFTIVLAYLLFSPIDSPYRYYGSPAAPKINFLDDLPVSHFVKSDNSNYTIFRVIYEYKDCRAKNLGDRCYFSFSYYDLIYPFLLENDKEFYTKQKFMHDAGVKLSPDEVQVDVEEAFLRYNNPELRDGLSTVIYIANTVPVILILLAFFYRRWVGRVLLAPFFAIVKLFRRIHKSV